MREYIKQLLSTGGVPDDEFTLSISDIERSNRQMLLLFMPFATLMTTIVILTAVIDNSFLKCSTYYMSGPIISLTIFVLAWFGKKSDRLIYIAQYIATIYFMAYALILNIFIRPNQQSTAFIVTMIIISLILTMRPRTLIIQNTIWITIFIIAVILKKPDILKTIEIASIIIYGLLSIVTGTAMLRIKIKEYILEEKLQIMSTRDQLTGLNNRNCYEYMLTAYPSMCKKSLSCIYIDINGLHDLNNTEGHKAGDEMLVYIANQVQKHFGRNDTYRIGGDEYVAFVKDSPINDTKEKLNNMITCIERKSYHVAIGMDRQDIKHIDINTLIKSAETKMYKNKEEWYTKMGKEHR